MGEKGRAVLVTGTSSGIGRQVALDLAARGHLVYTAARQAGDLAAWAGVPRVVPVPLDVRIPRQVTAAVRLIAARGSGLQGLVNNAGVGGLGLLATWTDEELREIFEVNLFGVHRVTNACLDLLLQSGGRIVNIGAQGGSITSRHYGPYTMTKHALEAYTECLDGELSPHGVRASIVQPGGVVSRVGENAAEGTLARFRRAAPPFAEEAERVLEAWAAPAPDEAGEAGEESEDNRKPSPPGIVSAAVQRALFDDPPRLRYLVGTRWEGDRVIDALLARLLDANESPVHGYTRDELVARLDRHLDQRRGSRPPAAGETHSAG